MKNGGLRAGRKSFALAIRDADWMASAATLENPSGGGSLYLSLRGHHFSLVESLIRCFAHG